MTAVTERGRRVFGSHDENGRWARGTNEHGDVIFVPTLVPPVSVQTQSKIRARTSLVPALIAIKHRHHKKRR
jgi:hypothetical protein